MKELDFDELDRAVNSLMTNVKKDDASSEQEKTVTLPSNTNDSSLASNPPTDQKRATPLTSPSLPADGTSKTSLATRRGGRFMDVVHPSSDMKKADAPIKPVSRQGATLNPVNNTPQKEDAVEKIAVEPTALLETTEPVAKSEWPDPLDMAKFKTSSEDEKPKVPVDQPVPQEKSDDVPPLTSPFLPDTKVEKRPLGGALPDEDIPVTPKGAGKENLSAYDPNDQLPALPTTEVEKPLPEELQGDLVAIESGHATPLKIPSEAPPSAKQSQEDDEAKPLESSGEQKEDKAPATISKPQQVNTTQSESPVSTGPVSIPQQYREEPNSGDQENGSIYDTDAYHQPLAHPAQKKSGWLWVVWILLILILGACVGAALFMFGII